MVTLTQAFDSRNAGARNIGVTGYTVNDGNGGGNGGGNYTVLTNAAAGTIAPAPLTITADEQEPPHDPAESAADRVVHGLRRRGDRRALGGT